MATLFVVAGAGGEEDDEVKDGGVRDRGIVRGRGGRPIPALHILEVLAAMEQPASLEAVAAMTQLTQSKAYRALRGLQEHGYVDHLGRSGYRIGSRSLALASLIVPRPDLL